MSWPPPPLPALATDRFALIVTALIGYVRTKIRAGVEWAVFDAAQARVRRIRNRFAALVVKYRAGTLPAPRPKRAPCPIEPADESEPTPKPARPVSLLPRNFAWLCGIVPQWAAGCGGQVLHLLDEPEMRELIAAAPQAGRLLRPLLWMTGRPCPDFLALPPRIPAPKDPLATGPVRPRRPRQSATSAANSYRRKAPVEDPSAADGRTASSRPAPAGGPAAPGRAAGAAAAGVQKFRGCEG